MGKKYSVAVKRRREEEPKKAKFDKEEKEEKPVESESEEEESVESGESSDESADESIEGDVSGDEIEDDEFLDSDDEEDEDEDEDDEEAEYERPSTKKRKVEEGKFSTAISKILASKIKAHDRDDPILVRSKKKLKDLEDAKLEAKARKAINAEKKQLENKDRVTDLAGNQEHERMLKQIAKKGVVKLFNAVTATQAGGAKDVGKTVGLVKKEEKVNEMSKEKFLDLIRSK